MASSQSKQKIRDLLAASKCPVACQWCSKNIFFVFLFFLYVSWIHDEKKMSFLPNNYFNVVKMKYFVLSFIRLSKLPPVSFTKFLLLSSSFAFRIFYCMLRPKRKFAVSFRRSFLQRRTLDMLLFWSNGWLRCFVFYHSPAMTKVKNVHIYQ